MLARRHAGLGKLIAFYDDNGISIDGEVQAWFTDDTPRRFEAYHWHVVRDVDGHDAEAVRAAIEQARAVTDKPSLICCKTIIGWGSPNKQGKEECHGAALGADEVALVRKTIGWEHAPFVVPDEIYAQWSAVDKGQSAEAQWLECFERYRAEYPDLAAEFERRMQVDARGMGGESGGIHRRGRCQDREGGDTKGIPERPQRLWAPAPLFDRGLRGPGRIQSDPVVGLHAHQRGRCSRQLHLFRCARVCHVRDDQRNCSAWRVRALRRYLPDVLRVCPQRGAHGGVDEDSQHLRLHPRFHRSGRGWPDPSGCRADSDTAHDSAYARVASV